MIDNTDSVLIMMFIIYRLKCLYCPLCAFCTAFGVERLLLVELDELEEQRNPPVKFR